jgi:TPR repeat protein
LALVLQLALFSSSTPLYLSIFHHHRTLDDAQYKLGYLYYTVDMVWTRTTQRQSTSYYKLVAAEQGNVYAGCNLGMMYDNGYGVEQDNEKARKYYILSVEKGYAGAQHDLGILYKLGNGIEQDCSMARHFFTLAVEQGDTGAQVELESFEFNQHGCIRK